MLYLFIALIVLFVFVITRFFAHLFSDEGENTEWFFLAIIVLALACGLIPTRLTNGEIRESVVEEDGSFVIFTDKDDTVFIWDGEEVDVFFDKEIFNIYSSGEYQIISQGKVNWYGGLFDLRTKIVKK